MFAVIYIPDFFLQAALRSEPQWHSRPVALIDARTPNPLILQLTESACAAGVSAGMTPTQGLARAGKLLLKARSLSNESSATAALLDCAWSFSPAVEATGEGIATLDLRGFSRLDYEQLGRKMIGRLLLLNLAAQVGMAREQDRIEALHQASHAG